MIVRPDIHDDVDTWIEPRPSKSTILFVQDRIVPIGDDEIESLVFACFDRILDDSAGHRSRLAFECVHDQQPS